MSQYDIVAMGAGHNGLVAAASIWPRVCASAVPISCGYGNSSSAPIFSSATTPAISSSSSRHRRRKALLCSVDPHPAFIDPTRHDLQRLAQARAQHTLAGVGIEQCPMGMTHHVPAVACKKMIFAIFEGRALVRAAVHKRSDIVPPAQDEDGVRACAVRIETTCAAGSQLIETAHAFGTLPIVQCFSGGPLGNHFSRELNRNNCELSAPIGTARAIQDESCRSMSASYST